MPDALARALAANPLFAVPLFDALPDVVFFIKDAQGRYVQMNQALVQRCGVAGKEALIGRTAAEVFGPPFGATFLAQDKAVLASGAELDEHLELHLYPDRDPGWCVTRKLAIRDRDGAIVGVCGISRDLAMPDKKNPAYRKLAALARTIQQDYAEPLPMAQLAREAGMSVAQVERYFLRIFGITPRQMIIKARLDAAARLLAGKDSIASIAQACGYGDHSAFTRQFKATVGMTPAQYRFCLR
ncbi:MAG: AraC family transcriptional regulator [Pseudomonadota bacterium]